MNTNHQIRSIDHLLRIPNRQGCAIASSIWLSQTIVDGGLWIEKVLLYVAVAVPSVIHVFKIGIATNWRISLTERDDRSG